MNQHNPKRSKGKSIMSEEQKAIIKRRFLGGVLYGGGLTLAIANGSWWGYFCVGWGALMMAEGYARQKELNHKSKGE